MEINLGFTWSVLAIVIILVGCAIKECCDRRKERKKQKMIDLGSNRHNDDEAGPETNRPALASHRNPAAARVTTEANMLGNAVNTDADVLDRSVDKRKIEDALEEVEEEVEESPVGESPMNLK